MSRSGFEGEELSEALIRRMLERVLELNDCPEDANKRTRLAWIAAAAFSLGERTAKREMRNALSVVIESRTLPPKVPKRVLPSTKT